MKYVECDCCGNKINIGEKVVTHRLFCGIYCSDKCFIKSKVPDRVVSKLSLDVALEYNAELREY